MLFEGDTADNVLFVVEGRLKVLTTTPDGRELVLGLRGPGELLGELTAIAQDGRGRYATVVAMDDLQVRVITGEDFRAFLLEHPSGSLGLLTMLVERLREADRQRVEFGSLDVPHRVARLLVDLAESGSGRPPRTAAPTSGSSSPRRSSPAWCPRPVSRWRVPSAPSGSGTSLRTGRRSIVVLDLDRLRAYATSL